jgi:hypothetical protein
VAGVFAVGEGRYRVDWLPVFYLKCGRFRLPDPSDAIGRLMGVLRGREYRILAPAEIGYAVRDTVDRMARSKAARETAAGL